MTTARDFCQAVQAKTIKAKLKADEQRNARRNAGISSRYTGVECPPPPSRCLGYKPTRYD